MKMRGNDSAVLVLLASALFLSFNLRSYAQAQSPPDSVIQIAAEAQGLAVVPADQLPRYGTFWVVQNYASFLVPLPCAYVDSTNPPVFYSLGVPGEFLEDDTGGIAPQPTPRQAQQGVTSATLLLQQGNAVLDLITQVWASTNTPTTSPHPVQLARVRQNTAEWNGNVVYLTNLTATLNTNLTMTASVSIAGGTNFVPYDLWTTTNVAASIASYQWNWLGIGYTGNRYTFTNQSANQQFYALAKPQRTMTLAWGGNAENQCNVPAGISNAVAVAGGYEQGLALLNNGNVVAWGANSLTDYVPTNVVGASMIAAGWEFNAALLTNGSVVAWGSSLFNMTSVPANLTNATVISAHGEDTLALRSDGTVVAWGEDVPGYCSVPTGLGGVSAIAMGGEHCLAVSNGFVVAWGNNDNGQNNVPANLTNAWDVADTGYHSLALKLDGTVVAWGDNSYGETNVPAGLSNVVAIAAGGDPLLAADSELGEALPYSLALKSDGTVVGWGAGWVLNPVDGLTNVFAIAGGSYHALAVRTGPISPVVTLEPTNQYQIAGGSVTFGTLGLDVAPVQYQWQFYGTNLNNATNATLTLTNVQTANQGPYRAIVSDANGSITSSNAAFTLVTPPVITSQSTPTNPVVIYGNHPYLSVTATAPGQTNGFPLSYQWRWNGTNISGATNSAYTFSVNDNSSGLYSVVVANAAGSTTAVWTVTVTNLIDASRDLLLIYNSNSSNSLWVLNYYLAHRPMVTNANVLGIGCAPLESVNRTDYTNTIRQPVLNWLNANPTKQPQYWILFLDIPSRINEWTNANDYHCVVGAFDDNSVSYELNTTMSMNPFVTHINIHDTNGCRAYIDKLAFFGATYSPGQLVISASAGGYTNTNYLLDDIRHGGPGYAIFGDDFSLNGSKISSITNALQNVGVAPTALLFSDGVETLSNYLTYTNSLPYTNWVPLDLQHPKVAANVAGYVSWGVHSSLGSTYPINTNLLCFLGNSGWWIIETFESYNGQWTNMCALQGNVAEWFSANAFGGTNFSNIPVGAVSHTDEPGLSAVNTASVYFDLWASSHNFAICAWNSRNTQFFQPIGDPLITK